MRNIKHTVVASSLVAAFCITSADVQSQPQDAAVDSAAVNTAASVDVTVPQDPTELPFLEEAYAHVKSGKWAKFAALILVVVTFAVRKYGNKLLDKTSWGKWLTSTDRGGVATVLLLALLGGISHALYVGADVNFDLAKTVVQTAVLAIGGFVGLKKLVFGNA